MLYFSTVIDDLNPQLYRSGILHNSFNRLEWNKFEIYCCHYGKYDRACTKNKLQIWPFFIYIVYVKVVSYLYDQTKTAKPHVFHTWLSWKMCAFIGIQYKLKSNGHQLLMQWRMCNVGRKFRHPIYGWQFRNFFQLKS